MENRREKQNGRKLNNNTAFKMPQLLPKNELRIHNETVLGGHHLDKAKASSDVVVAVAFTGAHLQNPNYGICLVHE